jgi:hypothetical protein
MSTRPCPSNATAEGLRTGTAPLPDPSKNKGPTYSVDHSFSAGETAPTHPGSEGLWHRAVNQKMGPEQVPLASSGTSTQ